MLKQLDVLIGFVVVMSIVSMLIMAINQAILSWFQLRGKQMMYGLEALFSTLKPDLGEKSKALAEAVLRHPLISDSAASGNRRGLASAIRPEELLAILKKLEESAGSPAKWIGNKTLQHADATLVQEGAPASSQGDKSIVTTLAGAAGAVIALLEEPAKALTQANEQVSNMVANLPEAAKGPIQALEARATTNIQSTLQTLEKHFNTVEDRAREWFATRAQQCNVGIAIALVLGLQLDAIALYQQLQTDEAYRSALVSSAATVQKQLKEQTDKATESAKTGPGDFNQSINLLKDLQKEATKLDKEAQGQGFQLIPTSYPGTFREWLGVAKPSESGKGLSLNGGHFLGMFFFVLLLSLGSPYWFNLLKTLTSFRPLLAQEVGKDKAAKKKKAAS